MASSAVEAAVCGYIKKASTPVFKNVVPFFDCASLTAWLQNPVERQRDGDDSKKQQTDQLRALDFLSFKNFVVVVRLAVCSQFDFGANFGAALTNVEETVNNPAANGGNQHEPGNVGSNCCEH